MKFTKYFYHENSHAYCMSSNNNTNLTKKMTRHISPLWPKWSTLSTSRSFINVWCDIWCYKPWWSLCRLRHFFSIRVLRWFCAYFNRTTSVWLPSSRAVACSLPCANFLLAEQLFGNISRIRSFVCWKTLPALIQNCHIFTIRTFCYPTAVMVSGNQWASFKWFIGIASIEPRYKTLTKSRTTPDWLWLYYISNLSTD